LLVLAARTFEVEPEAARARPGLRSTGARSKVRHRAATTEVYRSAAIVDPRVEKAGAGSGRGGVTRPSRRAAAER